MIEQQMSQASLEIHAHGMGHNMGGIAALFGIVLYIIYLSYKEDPQDGQFPVQKSKHRHGQARPKSQGSRHARKAKKHAHH